MKHTPPGRPVGSKSLRPALSFKLGPGLAKLAVSIPPDADKEIIDAAKYVAKLARYLIEAQDKRIAASEFTYQYKREKGICTNTTKKNKETSRRHMEEAIERTKELLNNPTAQVLLS